jgi:hypothetical protein
MQAARLPAARGWGWLVEAFRLYRRNPPLLVLMTLNYWLQYIMVFVVPFIGPIAANFLLQAIAVTAMNGCRVVDQRRPFSIDIVWSGFLRNFAALLKLGGLYVACLLALVGVLFALNGPDLLDLTGAGTGAAEEALRDSKLVSLLYSAVLLTLPLVLSFWFAPMLVAWNDLPAAKALFFSIVAVLRNWQAFAVYGAAVFGVSALAPGLLRAAVAALPETLGTLVGAVVSLAMIFVLMPTLFASIYVSYREVFAPPTPDVAS